MSTAPQLTTFAADRLASECYSKLLSHKFGPYRVIFSTSHKASIDEDRTTNNSPPERTSLVPAPILMRSTSPSSQPFCCVNTISRHKKQRILENLDTTAPDQYTVEQIVKHVVSRSDLLYSIHRDVYCLLTICSIRQTTFGYIPFSDICVAYAPSLYYTLTTRHRHGGRKEEEMKFTAGRRAQKPPSTLLIQFTTKATEARVAQSTFTGRSNNYVPTRHHNLGLQYTNPHAELNANDRYGFITSLQYLEWASDSSNKMSSMTKSMDAYAN